jgi:subtilisin family serine protease
MAKTIQNGGEGHPKRKNTEVSYHLGMAHYRFSANGALAKTVFVLTKFPARFLEFIGPGGRYMRSNSQPGDGHASTSGPRPEFWGTILQRGGEELRVEKISDRLTTRLQSSLAVTALQQQIAPLAVRAVASGQLVEWHLPAERLETVLAWLRQHPAVQFASHVYCLQASPRTWVYLTAEMMVQFVPGTSPRAIAQTLTRLGLSVEKPLATIPTAFIVTVTSAAQENPVKLANRLMQMPSVMAAEPNVVVETSTLYRPRDDRYPQQWHLFHRGGSMLAAGSHIDVEKAWDITRGSRSVVIAVSDDGFDLDHPDLQGTGKLVAPIDLKDNDAVPLPLKQDENHGTAVAGLAVGEENGSGIVGVAPGCSFMPIRTTGFVDDASIERLFEEAMRRGAAIISCSWSPASNYFSLTTRQKNAITRAATEGRNGKGCVVIFSAGNANRPLSGSVEENRWPQNALRGLTKWLNGFAVHPDVIAVAASTSLGTKAAYSNWGDHIAVAAPSNNGTPSMALPQVGSVPTGPELLQPTPGLGMVTSDRTQTAGYDTSSYTTTFGGTSSACPVVAGVVGLMLSINPDLTAQEVREILQMTTDKIVDRSTDPQLGLQYGTYDANGHSRWFGYGKVNAYKAVREAQRRAFSNRRVSQVINERNGKGVAIPDNRSTGASSSLSIRQSGRIADLSINVKLEHEFLGDITLVLKAPTGQTVLLQGRTLGSKTELQHTYTLANTPALVAMIGQTAQGTWHLQAIDHAPGATGKLLHWELTLGLD